MDFNNVEHSHIIKRYISLRGRPNIIANSNESVIMSSLFGEERQLVRSLVILLLPLFACVLFSHIFWGIHQNFLILTKYIPLGFFSAVKGCIEIKVYTMIFLKYIGFKY